MCDDLRAERRFGRNKSNSVNGYPRFRLYSRYDSFVSLRQRGMAHMVFSPALRRRKDTANTQSDLSSGRWRKPTRHGDRYTSRAELLRLGIDILASAGKNFIFQKRTLFSSKELYCSSTTAQNIFPQPVDFPNYGSSIGWKWGKK
jgi:hypothetical protein